MKKLLEAIKDLLISVLFFDTLHIQYEILTHFRTHWQD